MAERPGKRCSSWMRTRAAPTWEWIPTILESYMPECGRSRFTLGAAPAAVQVAACSSRQMAASPGTPGGAWPTTYAWPRKIPTGVYAEIKTGDGVPQLNSPGQLGQLWRSDDGGENWEMVTSDRQLRGRTHYYPRTEIAPDNAGPPPPFPPVCPRGPWESTAPIVPTDRANLPWDARTPLRTDFAAFGTSRETAGLQDCER